MLDGRVHLVAQTNVLLQLALPGDGGDDFVTVVSPQHRHLQVLLAVADEDGRGGVDVRFAGVLELPGSEEEGGENECSAQTDRAGQGDIESQGSACRK